MLFEVHLNLSFFLIRFSERNLVIEIVKMSGRQAAAKKGILVVQITPTVFMTGSCCFEYQLYIYQRISYYLDFDF